MNLLLMMLFSLQWLREAGARGEIADVTGRMGGEKTEIDWEGRPAGWSKLRLLKISEIPACLPPKDIRPGDIILIFNDKAEVLHAGEVTEDGHLRHLSGPPSVSRLSVAAYCARWRTAAGIKVLRKPWYPYRYTKRECMVPMRDGVRLYTAVYEPAGAGPKPILMVRNPYPVGTYGYGGIGDLSDKLRFFLERGYIIVEQNVRGKFMSEGDFENLRPLRVSDSSPLEGRWPEAGGVPDEATDTYDTISWLLENTLSNGSVGIYGVSYPGFYATQAALCGHPALKIVSPQAPVTDWWTGDDTHHNGAFMLCDMYGFGGSFFRDRSEPTPDWPESVAPIPDGADLYTFFKGRSIRQILRPLGSGLEFLQQIKAHPDYDGFWQERNPLRHLRGRLPAMLVVGGEYDAEDAWGAVNTYKAVRDQAPETESYFVYGPWTHGGWRDDAGYLEKIELPVFEYYLEGKGAPPSWHELMIPSGVDGVQGEYFDTTRMVLEDPSPRQRKTFALKPGSYVSDPADPVPYMDFTGSWRNKAYMWADQSFAAARPDVLSRQVTGRLRDTLWAIGPVKVHLRAAVSPCTPEPAPCHPEPAEGSPELTPCHPEPAEGSPELAPCHPEPAEGSPELALCHPEPAEGSYSSPLEASNPFNSSPLEGRWPEAGGVSEQILDCDFVVKLIDVAPDGTSSLVRADIAPARWRNSPEHAEALEAGKAFELDFTMVDVCHCFCPGHKLEVQVQSSWFPLAAMNPQTFVRNPYTAPRSAYIPLKIKLLRGSTLTLCTP